MADITKLRILQETFKQKFEIERYVRFVKEFFNELNIVQPDRKNTNSLNEFFHFIKSYTHVADYTDSKQNRIAIFAIELKGGRNVERARSAQRNFVSKLITNTKYDAAIVAFHVEADDRWRLSFVRLDVEIIQGKIKSKITPAKRFSYLVGKDEPCHTAMEQLYPIFMSEDYNPTIDKIEEAFSVEKVTKEFFHKYKEKYLQLKEELEKNQSFIEEAERCQFTSEQFAKKLMGQLVFLYFLQKKGWLGVKVVPRQISEKEYRNALYTKGMGVAPKAIIPRMYNEEERGVYRLNSKLLNELSDEDADILAGCFKAEPWGSGTKVFIRDIFESCRKNVDKNFFDDYLEPLFYEALNKKRGHNYYYKRFNCKIPFLNGGLFEPLKQYDWSHNEFGISNDIFSNRHLKGERDADGILDVFERYNFTMSEDEPLEREVAVDPEMLGKIFENLLDVKDRRSKGAFYTPREIVHYMCQESLANYLVSEINIPYQDIKDFILYGEIMKDEDYRKEQGDAQALRIPQSVYSNLQQIDNALANVKVADPAVGSGAFSLGMLSEIVKVRNNITFYLARLEQDKYNKRMLFDRRSLYNLKWETIKKSIFAVDIEPSAIDITKLRLWLAIVVDENINDKDILNDDCEEKNPKPLPNLDCNIMCGNSLIDEFEGIKLFDESVLTRKEHQSSAPIAVSGWQTSLFEDQVELLTEDLFKAQDQLFGEENTASKEQLKKKIDKTINNIIEAKLRKDNNQDGLKKYKESLMQKAKPYFLWKLEFAKVFKEKGGFDIVIGNPPYIGFHKVPNKDIFKDKYAVANGKYDYYVLFIEQGINLMKENGFLTYICPSYFYKRNYGKKTRELLLRNSKIRYIADFKDYQIFESALTYTCIFGLTKSYDKKYNSINIIENIFINESYVISQNDLKEPIWLLGNPKDKILYKVKENSNYRFGEITKSISQGIVTGLNEIYLLSEDVIKEYSVELIFLKKAFKGKDIKDGKLIDSNRYLFYPYKLVGDKTVPIDEKEFIYSSPNLYKYLSSFMPEILKREYFAKSSKKWYELWNCRKMSHFLNKKFVFAEISKYNDFIVVDECFYTDSACGAELVEEFCIYYDYLCLYLNSDVMSYIYKQMSVPKANGYCIYKNAFLKDLPVIINDEIKLKLHQFNDMKQGEFNRYINSILDLTKEEIDIIENNR